MSKKILSVILTFNLIMQSFSPFLVSPVYAEDSTPSATPTVEVTPTVEPSPTPTEEITPTPTETVSPTPETTPTPEITPTPTEEITPSPEISPTPTGIITPDSTPTPTVEVTPTIDPTTTPAPDVNPEPSSNTDSQAHPQNNDQNNSATQSSTSETTSTTTIPESVTIASQLSQTLLPQPTLTTDKPDYFPTDIAYISGTGFLSNTTYTLHIMSSDMPYVSYKVEVTSDTAGNLSYAYQLDGHYRPNYTVDALDASGAVVASYSFTDADPQITYDTFAGEISPQNSENWTTGNISGYKEGDTIRFRLNLDSEPGNLSGDLFVGFTSDPTCRFFKYQAPTNVSLDFDRTTDAIDSGAGFTATYVGLSQNGDDGVAQFAITSTALNAVRLNFTLQVDNSAAGCASGSSQHVQVDHATGDIKDSGAKALPIPANAVVPVTDITIVKTVPDTASIGDAISYTLTVTNLDADTSAQNVTITDTLPTGLTYVSASGATCTNNLGTITCNLGTLAGGASQTVTINVTVNNSESVCGATITNTATVSTSTLESDSTNNSSSDSTAINACSGTIELKKVWSGTGGQTTLNIGTTIGGTEVASVQTGTAGATPLTTGSNSVVAGTYYVSETGGLSSYNSALSCTDNGAGSTYGESNSVSVLAGHTVVCTFTNTLKNGTLVINKTAIGGNETFDFTQTGLSNFSLTTVAGTATTTFNGLTAGGTYSVSETSESGWNLTSSSCDRGTPSNITIEAGETTTCTFTNTKNATLHVVKSVVNNNGGTKDPEDFSFQVNGGTAAAFEADGQNNISVTPGTSYNITEPSVTGYTPSYEGCSGIVIAAGGEATCTITNNDDPAHLIVIKNVDNGTTGATTVSGDFTMTINSLTASGGNSFPGVATTGTDKTLTSVGTYSVTETGPSGYIASYSTDCSGTIALGETKTCTVTNTAIAPKLTVIKEVNNLFNGSKLVSDFSLYVGSTGVTSGATNSFSVGSYKVTETGGAGYSASFSGACDSKGNVSLALGDDLTCTITNSALPGTLTVTKTVIGGTADREDFAFSVNGDTPINFRTDGINTFNVDRGTYTITENAGPDYVASYVGCDSVFINNGGSATCAITNTRKTGNLYLDKIIFAGPAVDSDWYFEIRSLTGALLGTLQDGGSINLETGSYTITESTGVLGYTLTSVGGACSTLNGQSATATVGAGDQTCSFTNVRDTGRVKVNKLLDDDGDGTYETSNPAGFTWSLDGTGTNDMGATVSDIPTSIPSVVSHSINENSPSDYHFIGWYPTGSTQYSCASPQGTTLPATVNVTKDATAEITLCNARDTGTITIVKDSVPNNDQNFTFNTSGSTLPTTFQLDDWGNSALPNSQTFTVPTGNYTVTEANIAGWKLTGLSCTDSTNSSWDLGNRQVSLSVETGENITCTFTNTKYGTISGYKFNDFNGDGDQDTGESRLDGWTINLLDSTMTPINSVITGNGSWTLGQYKFTSLLPGTYYICETLQDGWVQTDPETGAVYGGTHCRQRTVNGNTPSSANFGNFEKAQIIVHKNVLGTNGSTDVTDNTSFSALLDGTNAKPISETTTATYDNLLPGTYTVSEGTEPAGYSWVSTTNNGVVTVTSGGVHDVYIVNKQNSATLRVFKHVVNDNGGNTLAGGFTMNVTGTYVSDDSFPGEEAGTLITLDAGVYSVNETDYPGYTKSIGANCSGTVAFGDTKTCTITNDDVAPKLTLIKNVIKDNGGNEDPDDFKLTIGGSAALSGVTQTLSANTPYAINETPLSSYSFISITGDRKCPSTLGGTVTLDPGDDITCTINNDDIAPSITLTKNAVGGSATAADFSLYIGGASVVSGQTLVVDANKSYSIDEDSPSGYSFTSISGDTKCPAVLGGTVTLDEDEDLSCTITNTRDTGTIVVNKIIDVDGDLETEEDQSAGENWQFDVDGTGPDTTDAFADSTDSEGSVTFTSLKTGAYTIVETTQPGYDLFSATCGVRNGSFDQTDSMGGVTVSKGGTTTCTFYNKPNGTIHGYKWNDDNGDGQSWEENKLSGWTIKLYKSNGEGFDPIDTMVTDSGSTHFGWYWFENLFPGQYKVCEVQKDGWTQTYPINANTGNCHTLTLPDGNSNGFEELVNATTGPVYKFGNRLIDPELTISRSNNAGVPLTPGSTYEHTITIKVTGNDISNLKLTDLLPKGVTFSGSYTVLNGSTDITGSITAPVYHSPGVWELGDFAEGDIITVKYLANISSDIQPGTYSDLAWAIGENPYTEGQSVFAIGENSEYVDGNFVGTDVKVVKDQTRAEVYDVEKKVVGQVLGASTSLPATGANELWLLASLISLYFGLKLIRTSK